MTQAEKKQIKVVIDNRAAVVAQRKSARLGSKHLRSFGFESHWMVDFILLFFLTSKQVIRVSFIRFLKEVRQNLYFCAAWGDTSSFARNGL